MKYRFKKTKEIKKLLVEVEAYKIVFDNLKVLPEVEENIRRKSILKSSVFSAKIEGIENNTGEDKQEIFNLTKAYHQIYLGEKKWKWEVKTIKQLQMMVMKGISKMAGRFRQEPWAIYNSAGFVVYLAPPYMQIPDLMDEYVKLVGEIKAHPVIKAAVAQFVLEKIHPFADGNGRTGRLVSALILKESNYHFRGILPLEECIDNTREEYYRVLESEKEITDFVEYFLRSMVMAAKELLTKGEWQTTERRLLPPRRGEILNIIGDHPWCSFDFISRRFSAINVKTLHYDLKKLQDQGWIEKLGKTRGAKYQLKT